MHIRSKGIIISYLKIAISMACGIVLSSALLRMLGGTEYGIYQTVAAFANNLILLEFGVGTVMIRNISMCRGRCASEEEIQRNITTNWTITIFLAAVLLLMSVLLYYAIPGIYANSMSPEQIRHGQRIFAVSVGHLLTTFLIHTINAIIFSFEDYTFGSLQSTVRTLIRTVLLLVLMIWFRNALVIALVDVALGIFCLLTSYRFCKKKLKIKLYVGRCDPAIIRASIPLTVAVFLQGVVSQANSNVDKVLIGMMLSPDSVSLYSVALYICTVFSSLVNVASSMYVPAVTQMVGQGLEGKELAKNICTPCRLTALISGTVLFGFIAVGKDFVEILYGVDYLAAWPIAVMLMSPAYVDAVVGVLVYVLDAKNKRMARSIILLFTTVLNVILTIFCLKRWGAFGAAAATAICTFIGPVLIMNLYYKKVLRIPVLGLFKEAFRGILVYQLMGCAVTLGVSCLIENIYISFLTGGVTFVCIALGGYFLFGMSTEEKEKIMKFLRKR